MATVNITLTDAESKILTAHAKLTSTTIQNLISTFGLSNAVNQALTRELNSEIDEKSVGEDVVALALEDRWTLINKLTQSYNSGSVPASIVTKIVARAVDYVPPVVEPISTP